MTQHLVVREANNVQGCQCSEGTVANCLRCVHRSKLYECSDFEVTTDSTIERSVWPQTACIRVSLWEAVCGCEVDISAVLDPFGVCVPSSGSKDCTCLKAGTSKVRYLGKLRPAVC